MPKQKSWKVWSPSDVEVLKILLQNGCTHEEISKITNRSVYSVQCKASKMFGGRKHFTNGDRKYFTEQQIKELYERNASGETIEIISKDVGICRWTLTNRFSRCGYKPVNVTKKIDIESVIKARANNIPWKEIPSYLGISSTSETIRVALSKHKKKSGS